jgi:erythromycin esterase
MTPSLERLCESFHGKRVAFIMYPEVGHTLPIMQLAKWLRGVGSKVLVLGTLDHKDLVTREGLEHIPLIEQAAPRGYIPAWLQAHWAARRKSGTKVPPAPRALYESFVASSEAEPLLRSLELDLFGADALLWYFSLVARKLGIPTMILETSVERSGLFSLPEEDPMRSRRARRAWSPGDFLALSGATYNLSSAVSEIAGRYGFPVTPEQYERAPKRCRIREFSLGPSCLFRSEKPKRSYLGLSVDLTRNEEADFPWERITKKPIVYVSLGTNSHAYRQPERLLAAVVAAHATLPEFQLVLHCGSHLSACDLPGLPQDAVVAERVPQLALLKCASVFVTHGGFGGLKEAVHFGVPMLVFPMAFDQFANADMATRLGIGLACDPDTAKAEDIRKKLLALHRGRYRQTLSALRSRIDAADEFRQGLAAMRAVMVAPRGHPLRPRRGEDADVSFQAGGFTTTGTAHIAGKPAPVGTLISAARVDDDEGDVFYASTDAAGAFTLALPAALGYSVSFDDQTIIGSAVIRESKDQTLMLAGWPAEKAPEEVVTWVRRDAVPIAGADPTRDVSDLAPLSAIVGSARVVGLGEATHGTREFFQLKHRMLEYLVEKLGFSVFAIEANYPESLRMNDYVLFGKGDPKTLLAGMGVWTWDTEEVLALIGWMRARNRDAKHKKKVKFVGFDMQVAHVAVAQLLEYLSQVEPWAGKAATRELHPLSTVEGEFTYAELADERRACVAKAIADLIGLFEKRRAAWSARTSPTAWAVARQHAVVVSQAEHYLPMCMSGFDWREKSMANNVRWLLDQEPKGTKMVVWAHNAHVNAEMPAPMTAMGAHLRKALGKDYVPIGFVFDRGKFQAMAHSEGAGIALGEREVGEGTAGDFAEAFHRAGIPLFALDLRHPPAGVVADWLRAPHEMREVGALFADEATMRTVTVLPRRFDAVIYVDETTRARPLRVSK